MSEVYRLKSSEEQNPAVDRYSISLCSLVAVDEGLKKAVCHYGVHEVTGIMNL